MSGATALDFRALVRMERERARAAARKSEAVVGDDGKAGIEDPRQYKCVCVYACMRVCVYCMGPRVCGGACACGVCVRRACCTHSHT